RPDAGGEGPRRQMAVAHHLAVALVIEAVAVLVDPVGDFGLDGLSQELLRSLAKDLRKDIFGLGQWHEANIGGRKTHGGVLLCRGGTLVDLDTPRVRRPFSTRYPQHSIIPRDPCKTPCPKLWKLVIPRSRRYHPSCCSFGCPSFSSASFTRRCSSSLTDLRQIAGRSLLLTSSVATGLNGSSSSRCVRRSGWSISI